MMQVTPTGQTPSSGQTIQKQDTTTVLQNLTKELLGEIGKGNTADTSVVKCLTLDLAHGTTHAKEPSDSLTKTLNTALSLVKDFLFDKNESFTQEEVSNLNPSSQFALGTITKSDEMMMNLVEIFDAGNLTIPQHMKGKIDVEGHAFGTEYEKSTPDPDKAIVKLIPLDADGIQFNITVELGANLSDAKEDSFDAVMLAEPGQASLDDLKLSVEDSIASFFPATTTVNAADGGIASRGPSRTGASATKSKSVSFKEEKLLTTIHTYPPETEDDSKTNRPGNDVQSIPTISRRDSDEFGFGADGPPSPTLKQVSGHAAITTTPATATDTDENNEVVDGFGATATDTSGQPRKVTVRRETSTLNPNLVVEKSEDTSQASTIESLTQEIEDSGNNLSFVQNDRLTTLLNKLDIPGITEKPSVPLLKIKLDAMIKAKKMGCEYKEVGSSKEAQKLFNKAKGPTVIVVVSEPTSIMREQHTNVHVLTKTDSGENNTWSKTRLNKDGSINKESKKTFSDTEAISKPKKKDAVGSANDNVTYEAKILDHNREDDVDV